MKQTLDESISILFERTNSNGIAKYKKHNLETMASFNLQEVIHSFHFDNYNFQFFWGKYMFNKILKLDHGV